MAPWTPAYSLNLTERDVKLSRRMRRRLPRLRLSKSDLVLLLTNGAWQSDDDGVYVFYSFHDPDLPEERWAIGEAAGLDDVTVALDRARAKIVGIARRGRRPRLRRRWQPSFRTAAAAGNLRLRYHARQRMHQRGLTPDDLVFVIRHGQCLHRQGQVFYTLLHRSLRHEWGDHARRLVGTTLVVCRQTTEIITVWRDRETAHRRLRRKPKQRPNYRRPFTPLYHQ